MNKNNLIYKVAGGVAVVFFVGYLMVQNDRKNQELRQLREENYTEKESHAAVSQTVADNQKRQYNYEANLRNNWSDYIKILSPDYSFREIGGIYDLKITAKNETKEYIDEIVLDVHYMKTSGQPFKTERITISNVGPSSSKFTEAPDSNRGTSVAVDIVSITARSFHFCYPGNEYGSSDEKDPFACY